MTPLERAFYKMQFGGKARLRLYRKLVRFLSNGVALPQALKILWDHASYDGSKPNQPVAMILQEWRRQIDNGASFGRAVAGWVPEKDRMVIEAGETGGRLDVALENAIYIQEGSKKILGAIIGGLAYPFFLVLIACGFLWMFGTEVVPAFDAVKPKETWTGTASQMAFMSDFVQSWLLPLMAGMVVLGGFIFYTMPLWTGDSRKFADKMPPWSLYRLWVGASFLLSLSALVKAGVPIPKILRLLQKNASPYFAERISRTLFFVNDGINVGEALYRTGFNFPDRETVMDLRSYATLDGFDETLEKIGYEWMDESIEKIGQQASILKNLSFLVLGAVFAWIANGIFSLQQQVASSAGM